MSDLVGRTLGAYRIESRLGVGGMGEVYRATHTRLNRPAAIKVLHANQAADPTFQARFLREARAAAALSHPNIVEVFDFGEEGDLTYLVMELIPDGSLRTLLRQRSAGQGWSLGLGVDLVRQAAEGLAYAHSRNMVHRDIKPDNLLLQRLDSPGAGPTAERYQLKISDFGLARLMEDNSELTATGMVMGTPTYMSPEQCQGESLDGRSDLYSLGVVLYEVVTGAPPFRVKSLSEAVFKHISTPPVPPRSVRPDLPEALNDVIMRCLEKNPADRFATGTELANALEGALGDTELRTIITTRDASASPTPSTPARVDSAAPTVADSAPSPQAPKPPARSAAASSARPSDDATISASLAPRPRAQGADRPRGPQTARAARMPWPQPDSGAAKSGAQGDAPAIFGIPRSVITQPRTLGIGGVGALALIALIVFFATSGARQSAGAAVKRGTPTPHASVSPTASPTPVESVKYQDALSSRSSKWPVSSHSYFSNGGYEVQGAWIAYTPVNYLADGTVSVRVRQLSGPADQFYGILFRGANDGLYYFFGITGDQRWTFSLVSGGNGTPLAPPTKASAIKPGFGQSNTLAVRSRGGHFVFYINGAQVGQVDNSAIPSGRIGLINTVGNLTVVYNDFVVTAPGA